MRNVSPLRSAMLVLAVASQLVSCGPEIAVEGESIFAGGATGLKPIEVPPPTEIISFDPAVDLGEVVPSGVDPAGSRPPPPPFDR